MFLQKLSHSFTLETPANSSSYLHCIGEETEAPEVGQSPYPPPKRTLLFLCSLVNFLDDDLQSIGNARVENRSKSPHLIPRYIPLLGRVCGQTLME